MTIVRIVLADPRTGRPPRGGVNGQLLIVLADGDQVRLVRPRQVGDQFLAGQSGR